MGRQMGNLASLCDHNGLRVLCNRKYGTVSPSEPVPLWPYEHTNYDHENRVRSRESGATSRRSRACSRDESGHTRSAHVIPKAVIHSTVNTAEPSEERGVESRVGGYGKTKFSFFSKAALPRDALV
jgi:hypothetical protein